MKDLISSIDKLHTTVMGESRIKNNLGLKNSDVVSWCKNAILHADLMMLLNKNWYVYYKGAAITVNASAFTIITAHKINAKVRKMEAFDYVCLEEFLCQAIFIPKGEKLPSRDIIKTPEIYIYIKDFGSQVGDLGVVAEQNGQIVGAAWTRIIKAYGNINNKTPELAVSILPEFRSCSIGTKLIKKLFKLLLSNGFTEVSLSVQKDNPALSLYKRLGFKILEKKLDFANHEDFIMLKNLI